MNLPLGGSEVESEVGKGVGAGTDEGEAPAAGVDKFGAFEDVVWGGGGEEG